MYWQGYLQDTGHAIQRGIQTGAHLLEAGLHGYELARGAYELGSAIAPYARAGVTAAMALL